MNARDRENTIRECLDEHPDVWNSSPPAKLAMRFGGQKVTCSI